MRVGRGRERGGPPRAQWRISPSGWCYHHCVHAVRQDRSGRASPAPRPGRRGAPPCHRRRRGRPGRAPATGPRPGRGARPQHQHGAAPRCAFCATRVCSSSAGGGASPSPGAVNEVPWCARPASWSRSLGGRDSAGRSSSRSSTDCPREGRARRPGSESPCARAQPAPAGSAPNSPASSSRSTRRRSFPLSLKGSSATNLIRSGVRAERNVPWHGRASSSSVTEAPGESTTAATIRSPHSMSGMPTTAAASTAVVGEEDLLDLPG